MKILFSPCHYIYDEYHGGSEYSWAFEIANRTALKNLDSVVITGFKKLHNEKPYNIIEIQSEKKVLDTSIKNAIVFSFKYFLETERQLKNNFDILHHVLPFSINRTFNLSLILKRKVTPSVIGPVQSSLSLPDWDKLINKKPLLFYIFRFVYYLLKPVLKILSNLTLKRADVVVVINGYTKNLLIKNGIDKNKLIIIPPGIDIKKFEYISFDKKRSDLVELLVVCYLVKRKAVDLVIKAINEVVKEKKNIILRIIGDGPQKENLQNLVDKFKLGQYVVFEDFVPNSEVQKYYQKAHIFVSMSRSESWGQMYLEAMASGLPIITTKNNGSLSIIKNERFAYLVEQEDYIDLSKKILRLLVNINLIAELGENARFEAEKYYDWDNCIIPKYLEIYNKLIKNHE
jgi:glycosyltransferase involved in cell wall biosynthesis